VIVSRRWGARPVHMPIGRRTFDRAVARAHPAVAAAGIARLEDLWRQHDRAPRPGDCPDSPAQRLRRPRARWKDPWRRPMSSGRPVPTSTGLTGLAHLDRHRRRGKVAEYPVDLLRVTFAENDTGLVTATTSIRCAPSSSGRVHRCRARRSGAELRPRLQEPGAASRMDRDPASVGGRGSSGLRGRGCSSAGLTPSRQGSVDDPYAIGRRQIGLCQPTASPVAPKWARYLASDNGA
jgi:hypothetical protein